ncbi:MAG: hypothetical protein HND57_02210 [Planctomycetes bacterium]|nr:hypothetical protein [Planctomycetota bacterium]
MSHVKATAIIRREALEPVDARLGAADAVGSISLRACNVDFGPWHQ